MDEKKDAFFKIAVNCQLFNLQALHTKPNSNLGKNTKVYLLGKLYIFLQAGEADGEVLVGFAP